MKYLLVTLFLLISFLGFGQSVSAPDPKSFIQNTANQDASGFVLNGFNTTATLLCAIGLPQAPAGTTFNLTTTTGLTPASGFTMGGNKTRLVFTGTMANINAALTTLKINTPVTSGNIQISVSATVNPAGFFYNPNNGHFYRPIASGTTYPNAKLLSSQQTFKGQQGYLVTLTSADEENFVIQNVPQNNIWIALTDEAVEGQWRLDAGPEAGRLIKTSNGQLAGNIQGQYNNWCGGEPNNSNNEDYAVTKWGGGSCWNDLPANFNNPYIIEFGTWTNPDDQTFTEFVSNSVTYSNGAVLRAQFNFEFGSNITRTNFTTKLLVQSNNQYLPTTNVTRTLNGLGKVDMTVDLDTAKVNNNFKSHAVELNTTNISSLYNNIVTVSDVFLAFKELSNRGLFGDQSGLEFSSGIQFMNADIDENGAFDEKDTYKLIQHLTGAETIGNGSNNLSDYIKILPKSEYDLTTKQNWNTKPNISTNVYSPINLSSTTLLNSFTYSVFWKGDVNLSHSPLQASGARTNTAIATEINAYLISEIVDNKVIVTISIDPLQEAVVGTQFQLNYDNTKLKFEKVEFTTKGNPTNYGNNRGNFINIGSLITSGIGVLDNTTEYKVIFTPINNITDILGLTSISETDAVNSNGLQLNVKIK